MSLPLCNEQVKKIDITFFLDELLDAIKYLSIYETKMKDIRLEKFIFLPNIEMNEVVSSLNIEGTSTKIEDYYEEEADQGKLTDNVQMIKDYRNALSKGTKMAIWDGFSDELFFEIHKIILNSSKKDITIGKYKNKNNYIGKGNIKIYNPPTFEQTKYYMDDLISFINSDTKIHPLIKCAIIHAQFESIHPFDDGNGRIGRILIPIFLCYCGLLEAPLFYISEAINKDKFAYYSALQDTRDGNYNEWVKYFLSKCISQTKKHIELLEKINSLFDSTKAKLVTITNSVISEKLTMALFKNPVITSKILAESVNISTSQANRHLNNLVNKRILYSNYKQRNTHYYFRDLLLLIN